MKAAVSWVINSKGDVVFTLERRPITYKLRLPGEAVERFIQEWPVHTDLQGDDAVLAGRIEVEDQDD